MTMALVQFSDVFKDKTSGNKKFLSSEYLEYGHLSIVDQGQATVAGFTDEVEASCKIKLPCIIFGDHTKKFQFQEESFALGADGVKALEVADGVDPKYAYYALSQFRFPEGTGYSRHFKFLKEATIPLPNDTIEQRRIAATLDKAGAICRKRQEALKLADDLVKSQFIEMFGDPVTNPKGWPMAKIGDVAQVLTGGTPSRNNPEYYLGTIPWVKTGEIEQGLIYETEECISEMALKKTNCKLLPVDTIMLAMYGQGKTRGQSGVLKIQAATNQACAAILPNQVYNTTYLHLFLRLQYDKLRSLGRGAQQANLNLSMVRDFPVLNAPLSLQNEFAAFVEQADKSKFTMLKKLKEAETLCNALMQQYFGYV